MRKSKDGTNYTVRNQSIRMCIGRALIELLEKKELEEIRITELVKGANVSRMTFYKYYKTKREVLSDYMYEIVNEYMKETFNRKDIGGFREYTHICHCFHFFKEYHSFALTLLHSNLYSVIIDALNEYMDMYVLPKSPYSRYELYYYAGALCNTYMKWVEGGMKESPEEIAGIVYKHL